MPGLHRQQHDVPRTPHDRHRRDDAPTPKNLSGAVAWRCARKPGDSARLRTSSAASPAGIFHGRPKYWPMTIVRPTAVEGASRAPRLPSRCERA